MNWAESQCFFHVVDIQQCNIDYRNRKWPMASAYILQLKVGPGYFFFPPLPSTSPGYTRVEKLLRNRDSFIEELVLYIRTLVFDGTVTRVPPFADRPIGPYKRRPFYIRHFSCWLPYILTPFPPSISLLVGSPTWGRTGRKLRGRYRGRKEVMRK